MNSKNFIFLNPSANMLKIGYILKEFQVNVLFLNTRELPLISPNCVHVIYKDVFFTVSKKNAIDYNDKLSIFIKKSLRYKYILRKIRKELSNIDESLYRGDVLTLMLFNRKALLKYEVNEKIEEIESFKEINIKEGNIIVSNIIPYLYLARYVKEHEILSIYETDFDLVETLGNDYYICFDNDEKIEFYVFNKYLCIIHKDIINPEKLLFNKFPFLQYFSFRKLEYIYLVRNHNPWMENFSFIRTLLFNDYSFGGTSVKMSNIWYDTVGRHLCTEKLW
jgi:hypothetical protein